MPDSYLHKLDLVLYHILDEKRNRSAKFLSHKTYFFGVISHFGWQKRNFQVLELCSWLTAPTWAQLFRQNAFKYDISVLVESNPLVFKHPKNIFIQIIPKCNLPCEMEPPVIKFGQVWTKIILKIENVGAWKPFWSISIHENDSTRGLPYPDTVHQAL